MDKINVLYICTDWDQLAGSSASLFNMVESVKDDVHPIILFYSEGKVCDYFREHHYECIVHPFFYLWEKRRMLKAIIHHPSKMRLYRYWKIDSDCAKYVSEYLKDREVQIVHSNTSIVTVGCQIAKKLKAKHIWHIREFLDLDFHCELFLGRNRLRRIISNADVRICISNALYQHWNFRREHTFIVGNAVVPSIKMNINYNKLPYVVFCSMRLTNLKGADVAVRSFVLSGVANQGIRLKMIGFCSDEYKQYLLNQVKEFQIDNYIEFEGFQPNIIPYLKDAKAFLMCSPNEGLGRVTIEAMYSGCPVIAKRSGGSLDFIEDYETGYFYDTEQECANLIEKLCQSTPTDVINKAQDYICATFTEEVYQKKIMNIYRSIL